MNLQQFVTNEQSINAYKTWLQNPMTRQVLEFAQSQIQKSMSKQPPPIEGVEALQRAAILYSITYGRQELLEFITTLDSLAMPSEDATLPEPDYGATDIMLKDFYETVSETGGV